jgi:glycosyltransferase involved in cell wall biosynthesis
MHVIGSREEGGVERLYLRLTAALAAQGEEVLCVLRPSSVLVQRLDPDLPKELVRMRSVFDPFARARLAAVARGFGAQIVQTYMGRATRIVRVDPRRAPGVVHVARVGGYGDVKGVRHAHGWLASSEGIRQHLVDEGLPEERVFHVPHLLEPPPATLDPVSRAQQRASLGIEADSVLVLCLGRLHRDRGIDLMLEALVRLPDTIQGRPLRLLVVGDGPQREPLKTQARSLGLEHRVHWLAGEATPWPYMALADLFVYPSRESAVGTGILEAWNHGLPVVASRTSAGRELLTSPELGLAVEVDDAQALADAVEKSLQAPLRHRDVVVRRTREIVNQNHTARAVVFRCLEAYRRLVALSA